MRWDDDDRWRMHDGFASGGGWIFMLLVFVLLVGLAVTLLVVLLRSPGQPHATPPQDGEAERILRRRFAAGEIDEDEFRQRMATLAEHRG